MALLPIVYYPAPVLKKRCEDVTQIDQGIVDLIDDMSETMYAANGIGLAAPQVARSIRLLTVDVEPERGGDALLHLINPVIAGSHGRTTYDEGCLSFPGVTAEVKRKEVIHVQAFDKHGKELDFEADGLLSICIQHELDHLNGVTFLDRLSAIQRRLLLREYKKKRDREKQEREDKILEEIRSRG